MAEYWADLTRAVNGNTSTPPQDDNQKAPLRKTADGVAWPLAYPSEGQPVVTSLTGHRTDPVTGQPGTHTGVDIATISGTDVYSIADGEVVHADWQKPDESLNDPNNPEKYQKYLEQKRLFDQGKLGYGKFIIVKHATGFSYYAHLSDLQVRVGDKVKAGERIALSGNTGKSTGPHLHFEYRNFDWEIQDPLDLYPTDWYMINTLL